MSLEDDHLTERVMDTVGLCNPECRIYGDMTSPRRRGSSESPLVQLARLGS